MLNFSDKVKIFVQEKLICKKYADRYPDSFFKLGPSKVQKKIETYLKVLKEEELHQKKHNYLFYT